ncbi:MAG: hypothetical protein H6595_14055 [Flavobacteriales bacterium]|nr:hypothetical protein [Flavobacteriales bacterium]MCB9168590.1 hypothetical protein [Flavobacteriales bacterium]
MTLRLLAFFGAFIVRSCVGQTTFHMMAYNLLNFPDPNPAGKQDTLAKILAYHPVDLLVCEEVKTAAGAALVLNNALNVNGGTRFSLAPYIAQQSDPWSNVKLAQCLFYDHDKFTLKRQETLLTAIRDINVFTLYVNDVTLPQTQDTTFLTIYAVHLKASSGTSNENERADMAQVLMDHLATLPVNSNVIVTGDMNMYAATEPAYGILTATNNGVILHDPLNFPGNWNSNPAMAAQHTQSTRTNAIYSDGAGGGLDDRFDVGLFSDALLAANNRIHMVQGSYKPLGNSGTCFNQSITSCSTVQTPAAILRALYYMSDHLPLVYDLDYSGNVTGVAATAGTPAAGLWWDGRMVHVRAQAPGTGLLRMMDPLGRTILQRELRWSAGDNSMEIGMEPAQGTYLLQLCDGRTLAVCRIVTLRP